MSDLRICGVGEVPSFIEQFNIKKLLSCLSNYKIVDMIYSFTPSVISLDPPYWNKPENWMRLEMEDSKSYSEKDAPTMQEVVKGITFGANALRTGQNLLVHCQLGISRSPAMAIGSLLAVNPDIKQAFDRVKSVRPKIDPNPLIIELLDQHFNMNGELIKYNNEYRSNTRAELKSTYLEMVDQYITDSRTISIIMENIASLDRISNKHR